MYDDNGISIDGKVDGLLRYLTAFGEVRALAVTGELYLLDENAASHIALGNAYEVAVSAEDVPNISLKSVARPAFDDRQAQILATQFR